MDFIKDGGERKRQTEVINIVPIIFWSFATFQTRLLPIGPYL